MASTRRGWFVSVLCIASFLWAVPSRGEVLQPKLVESGSVIVTARTAEVREGPSRRAEVITVVEKGEVFEKQGRTGGWYYIKIDEDAFGWISGRAIRRYKPKVSAGRSEVSPTPEVTPPEVRYFYPYPYDPAYPYGYSYYYWGQPSFSWEWYYYGGDRHRDRSWDHDRDYDRDRDGERDDRWRDERYRTRDDDRSKPPLRGHVPRMRPPLRRR